MSPAKTILVTGATGKQGRSVVQSLLANPLFNASQYTIAVVTRDPTSPGARALSSKSSAIRPIRGDYKDPKAIFRSLPGKPWAIYVMTILLKDDQEFPKICRSCPKWARKAPERMKIKVIEDICEED